MYMSDWSITRQNISIIRRVFRAITSHALFDTAIMAVILANVVVMCVDHFDQRQYEDSLWYVPLLSFIIFTYIHVYIYAHTYIYARQRSRHVRGSF
jgi:hypothetical protein